MAAHINEGMSLIDSSSNLLRFSNIQDRLGRTCLHIACQHGVPIAMLSTLLEKCSADPTIEDIEGLAAIHYALDFDRELLVDWFIEKYGIKHCIEGMTVK